MINPSLSLEDLNQRGQNTLVSHLNIECIDMGEDFITARMPVDHTTRQPLGILHGGASVALAETLGSIAANCCVDIEKQVCVGLEINSNHIKSATKGYVYGTTRPIHIGKSTHVWEIRIVNEQDQLINISRITMAVLDRKEKK